MLRVGAIVYTFPVRGSMRVQARRYGLFYSCSGMEVDIWVLCTGILNANNSLRLMSVSLVMVGVGGFCVVVEAIDWRDYKLV